MWIFSGIRSCFFTKSGSGFYLGSPSELIEFSVSARTVSKSLSHVELQEGMRPVPEPVLESVPEAAPVPVAEVAAEKEEQKTEGLVNGDDANTAGDDKPSATVADDDKPTTPLT